MGETAAGKDLFVNPYVAQMDRFAGSLKHLSDVFLGLEKKRRTFTGEEIDGMAAGVSEKVCAGCEKRDACGREDPQKAARMVYEIIGRRGGVRSGAEHRTEAGAAEEVRHGAPGSCGRRWRSSRWRSRKMVWSRKMVMNREGCAASMNAFAELVQHAARELDAGICVGRPPAEEGEGEAEAFGSETSLPACSL